MNFLQITKKIISAVIIAFILLLLVAAMPIQNNIKALTVLSGSMEPTIKTGSLIFIIPQQSYNVDDIITFGGTSNTDLPKTHRIIEIQEGKYITKGDANDTEDFSKLNNSDIKGKVIIIIPYIGYLISFIQTKNGVIAVFTLIAILLFLEYLFKPKKHE